MVAGGTGIFAYLRATLLTYKRAHTPTRCCWDLPRGENVQRLYWDKFVRRRCALHMRRFLLGQVKLERVENAWGKSRVCFCQLIQCVLVNYLLPISSPGEVICNGERFPCIKIMNRQANKFEKCLMMVVLIEGKHNLQLNHANGCSMINCKYLSMRTVIKQKCCWKFKHNIHYYQSCFDCFFFKLFSSLANFVISALWLLFYEVWTGTIFRQPNDFFLFTTSLNQVTIWIKKQYIVEVGKTYQKV